MGATTKMQNKGQVTIPTRVREQAGLAKGDVVEFSYERGKIVITPKLVVDRSRFPSAGGDYTPAQRRFIDREIAKSLADAKSGRALGPFDTAGEAVAAMKAQLKRREAAKKPKRSA